MMHYLTSDQQQADMGNKTNRKTKAIKVVEVVEVEEVEERDNEEEAVIGMYYTWGVISADVRIAPNLKTQSSGSKTSQESQQETKSSRTTTPAPH